MSMRSFAARCTTALPSAPVSVRASTGVQSLRKVPNTGVATTAAPATGLPAASTTVTVSGASAARTAGGNQVSSTSGRSDASCSARPGALATSRHTPGPGASRLKWPSAPAFASTFGAGGQVPASCSSAVSRRPIAG